VDLSRRLDLPLPLIRVLAARGFRGPEAVDRFLNPRLSDLSDPFGIPDMTAAVSRLWRAIDRKEPVAVYGDYDVDGLTAAALVVSVLTRLGGRATPFIPSRVDEGYGLTPDGFARCVETHSPSLMITVDCGTSSAETVREAARMGIDVIITDHHETAGPVAPAAAVVNPKRTADERVRMLAGVGVAFKLCHALLKQGRDMGRPEAAAVDLRRHMEWIALGTVADAVPLQGENRILASHGLSRFPETPSVGLKALMEVAGIGPKINAYHLAFVLGPRLNAAGRLGNAQPALELLLTDDGDRARELAAALDAANAERKKIETRILEEADARIRETFVPDRHFGLVVGQRGWHVGVIGIVASRLCARYSRPVVVVAFDENGIGRGSCRSVDVFDLVAGLECCADLLQAFGGHALAAGLSVGEKQFAAFCDRFATVCAERLRNRDLQPVQPIDAWIQLREANEDLMRGIEQLAPFGEGNPEPVWGAQAVRILGAPRVVGTRHLKWLCADGSRSLEAIAFNMAERQLPDGAVDIAFTLERNCYQGEERLQLNVQDFRPASRL
jgi:single-stranded-DNA-specific exonuclease